MMKLELNKKYLMIEDGEEKVGTYVGQEDGYSCSVCGKGYKAYVFNFFFTQEEYESIGYGKKHLPKIIKEV